MYQCVGRAGPLREGGDIISEGGVINLIDEDPEERGRLCTRVRLKLRIDLDDECGGDGRKQASLFL